LAGTIQVTRFDLLQLWLMREWSQKSCRIKDITWKIFLLQGLKWSIKLLFYKNVNILNSYNEELYLRVVFRTHTTHTVHSHIMKCA